MRILWRRTSNENFSLSLTKRQREKVRTTVRGFCLRQSAAEAAGDACGCEAHAAGTLGHDAGTELRLWVHPNRRKVKRPDGPRPEPPLAAAKTLYVGDGINDAPAMMAATVG